MLEDIQTRASLFVFVYVCLHVLGITWTCQSISLCRPSHRPHRDPAPGSQWLDPQTAASAMHTTH